jgi:hypothetical protein
MPGKKTTRKSSKKDKVLPPTSIAAIDDLASKKTVAVTDYVRAVSAYVKDSDKLTPGQKKSAQIRLSNALGNAFAHALQQRTSKLKGATVGETKVSGALRTANADVSEAHPLDGLRLAVELKPVNLAVGRAIWNRFGDLRTFAVNLHLKFPFCVVGGVLVIPVVERTKGKDVEEQEVKEQEIEEGKELQDVPTTYEGEGADQAGNATADGWRSTRHLIERAVERLVRAGGRKTEGDAAHLLEAISVIAYDPFTGEIDAKLPPASSGLRWDDFIQAMAAAYDGRFEG